MNRYNLKITSSDTNASKKTMTINYVNGSLSMGDYHAIATTTNALTSMTYISSQLNSIIDLDEAVANDRTIAEPKAEPEMKSTSPFARK